MDMQSLIDALRRADVSAFGDSGGTVGMRPGDAPMMNRPAMAGGRIGYRGENLDAGVSGTVMRLPDGRVIRTMGPVDVGYSVPMMGGRAGVRASIGPKDRYNAQLMYQREF
jgi:hypothetical protein